MQIAVILLPQTAIRRAASGRLGTRRPEISAPKGRSAGSATVALARILFACRIVPRPSGVGPMRDYYPFVTRIVAGLDSNTGESRRVLYGRARAALCEQLRGVSPPLTDSEITRERLSLEAAIRRFEAEAIRRPRNAPMDAATAAASSEATEIRPLQGGPPTNVQAEPSQLGRDEQHGQTGGERDKLVELALLAQVVEAREPKVRKPVAIARAEEGGRFLDVPPQHRGSARQRVSAPAGMQPVSAAQDLLTKLIEARQDRAPADNAQRRSRLRKLSLTDAPRAVDFTTPLLGVLYFAFGFAQLVAFFHGLQTGFGLGGVASIGIFMLLYLTGSVGSIPMAIVSFYGAWRGWQWPIWGAALFAFPFIIFSFAFLGVGGFYNLFNRKKASPIVPAGDSRSVRARWRRRARAWGALLRLLSIPGKAPQGRPRAGRW